MLKGIRVWLSNLSSLFLHSLKDDRWLMFYLFILLVILLNISKKDSKNGTVYNKHRTDADGEEDDGDEGEGGDERDEDEDTDDDDDDDDDNDDDDGNTDDDDDDNDDDGTT